MGFEEGLIQGADAQTDENQLDGVEGRYWHALDDGRIQCDLWPVGIVGSELTPAQRDLLMEVIEFFTSVMADDIAALRRAKIQEDGIDDIAFAWAGGTSYGDVSYFRVQGPSFLIEFDHTQRDPNHIHTGWRDFDGDFGRDVLREHLAMTEH